jgi:hypothetical protein
MDIKTARKILGKDGEKIKDIQIKEEIDTANMLSNILLDMWLKMSIKERKKLRKTSKIT